MFLQFAEEAKGQVFASYATHDSSLSKLQDTMGNKKYLLFIVHFFQKFA